MRAIYATSRCVAYYSPARGIITFLFLGAAVAGEIELADAPALAEWLAQLPAAAPEESHD